MAQTETKTYDPAGIVITIGGAIITGIAAGTFVQLVRNVNNYDLTIGGDGQEGIRTKRNDRSALLTLTLAHTANANKLLSNLANRDEADSDGVVPVSITDLASPDTVYLAGKGWIEKPADAAFADTPQGRAWAVRLVSIPMSHGGTPATAALAETLS